MSIKGTSLPVHDEKLANNGICLNLGSRIMSRLKIAILTLKTPIKYVGFGVSVEHTPSFKLSRSPYP